MNGPWEAYGGSAPAPVGPWAAYAPAQETPPAAMVPLQEPEAADHGLSEREKLSPLQKAISPITSYPATYDRMNKDARAQVSHGIDQISHPDGVGDVAKGVANTALGAAGYVTSPISAAYRSIVGQPVEDVTGIPREQTEFAAQLLTPGIGLTGAAKAPVVTNAAKAAPSIPELKAAASAGYNSPEVAAVTLKPTAISKYSEQAQTALNNEGFDENLAPKTFGILGKLQTVPEGSVVTGQNIQSLRRMLGKAAGATDPTEAAAATHAINSLDDLIPNIAKEDVISGDPGAAAKILETARGDYSAAMQAQKIDNKTVQAEVRAAASNSGMNVANTVRQRMADVVLKPSERRGLLPDEIAAAQQIAEGTRGQNVLRAAGNMMGGGGGLGAAVTGGIGALTTPGGVGGLIPIAGFAMKALANKMTLNQAQKLSEMIRSRAPLASSLDKFEVNAASLSKSRDPKVIAGTVLAARNLSNNLRSAGFNFSPGDLLSGLQSPSSSSAQDQQ